MVARPFSFPSTNSLQIKNMKQVLEREVSSIKPFSLPGRGNNNSGAPSGPMTSLEPRVAGQSPKHTSEDGEMFSATPKCPRAHVPHLWLTIPNAYHNLSLFCPKSSPALCCPPLSSVPLTSVLTDHLCRCLQSKLDFSVHYGLFS